MPGGFSDWTAGQGDWDPRSRGWPHCVPALFVVVAIGAGGLAELSLLGVDTHHTDPRRTFRLQLRWRESGYCAPTAHAPPPPPLWAPIPPRDSGFLSVRPAQDGDSRPGGRVCLHLDWAGAAEGRVRAGAYWSRRDPGGKLPLYLVVPPTGVSQALVQTSCTAVQPNHTLPHVQSWHEPHANPQK